MNFNLFNSLILTGILQGLVLGLIVLISKKYDNPAARWLGCLITIFSVNNLQYYLQDSGIITSAQLFRYIFIPYQLLSGPVLLFYGYRLIYPEKSLSKKMYLTLVPFAIFWGCSLYIKFMYALDLATPGLIYAGNIGLAAIEFISIFLDLGVMVYLLRHIRPNVQSDSILRPELEWFRNIIRALSGLSILWLAISCYTFGTGGSQTAWYLIWIPMSVLIYWLGHIGVYKYGVQEERKKIRIFSIEHGRNSVPSKAKNEHIAAFEKLVLSNKRYLDPNLTLDLVADELKVSKSHLSRMVNAELQTGFPEYINSLRIEEAKTYLSNPDFENYTLVAIGLEAGFSSKTTFNHTFKKLTGLTPSEYKNQFANPVLKENIA